MTSFAEVYQAHAKAVFRFALHLTGNRAEAEDLTAETFARLWTARSVRLTTVKAYLFAIARNLYLEQRRVQHQMEQVDEQVEDGSPSPEAIAVGRDEAKRLWNFVQALPEIDRSALLMRADALSYEEISRALGITLSNTKVKIHRARVKMAMLLRKGQRP